jgi:S-DNA-T family DNA segregation ATPase FtsK/SpoIIIE
VATSTKRATSSSPSAGNRRGARPAPAKQAASAKAAKAAKTAKTATSTRRTTTTTRKAAPPKSPAPPPRPGLVTRMARSCSAALGRQADDVWGVLLLVTAALAGLGIYFNLAGPAGRALGTSAADVVGWGRLMVTPALLVAGVTLIRGSARQVLGRVVLGCLGVFVAISGLVHLARGPQQWSLSHPRAAGLSDAGGVLGALVGAPLRQFLGPWGAGLVLVTVLAVALLILTGTRAGAAGHHLGQALAAVGRRIGRGARWLATVGNESERQAALQRHPVTTSAPLFDQDGSALTAVAPVEPAGPRSPAVRLRDAETGGETGAGSGAGEGAGEGASVAEAPLTRPAPAPRTKVEVSLPTESGSADPHQLRIALGPAAQQGAWRLPPLALLKRAQAAEVDKKLVEALGRTLEDSLAAHGVETRLVGMTVGPTVTRYELELGPGVKVAKVTSLHKDIAYAMASADVRILAPIPGRSAIGVEVPNKQRQLVALGDILCSVEAHQARHPLEVAMGRDIAGRAVMANLADMPHILIAGATGAGKSSCINSLITSILVRCTPDQVRMILVDPKRVELGQYNGLPHLLTQVVVNPKKAANALAWAVHEMERRYDLLAEVGVRDITGYNSAYDRGDLRRDPGSLSGSAGLAGPPPASAATIGMEAPQPEYERLPFIVVVVDELNDLMMVAARDVEESICRIAQMARAVGIHLVIATQRPSVDVITGVIKANVPSRLAFAVSSLADSRVILDQPGAERLIGQGDMLLLGASSSVPRRIQGAWVSEEEVRKLVAHWRRQSQPQYVDGVEGDESAMAGSPGGGSDDSEDDDQLVEQALELIVRSQLGSTSMLQRKLRVGFARAGRIMDLLEQRGVVGPSEGSKARAVLMTVEELEERSR